MAKREKVKKFSIEGFDNAHYQTTEQYTALVAKLYDMATKEITTIFSKENINTDKPFSFADYPKTLTKIQAIIQQLANNVKVSIENGSKRQWLFANKKNDAFLNTIIESSVLKKVILKKHQDHNLDALKTFQKRKVDGMNLSQRVWKYTKQYKDQIETALDVGLGEGKSAAELSKDVRENLQNPDALFRRVRDKRGQLVLSKKAQAFHPGTGKYRSAHKNAMRLTRSEINMAYREADWKRWQTMDFIIGFEIKRSNREKHCTCKLCDRLQGVYPKTFKFVGWHPQCMCYCIPILEDFFSKERKDDRVNRLRSALYGTEYKKRVSPQITEYPEEFKKWVNENAEAQKGWNSTPYFIRDNFIDGKLENGLVHDYSSIEKNDVFFKANESRNIIQGHSPDKRNNERHITEVKEITSYYQNITKLISKIENDIRKNSDFETLVVLDKNGNALIDKRGEATSVSVTPNEIFLMKDNVVTHNHPRGWRSPEGTLGRIGSSFSFEDISLAIKADVAEIRAVTPLYTFSMKRPEKGWVKMLTLKREYELIEQQVREEMFSIIGKKKGILQKEAIKRAESMHYHLIWKRFCEKYNIEYTKTKTSQ
ncbi:hypothetical protein [Capnocytophaga canis]|uniref:hypothetical protein n=1 Tax=Capnocytophaga canis TaxID=1848903 RepID=UPI0037CED875